MGVSRMSFDDLFEDLVMTYLTKDPFVFISPQYDIGKGSSYPDFVALNFREKKVCSVEVSTGYNTIKNLAKRVANRQTKWIDKLKDQLQSCPNPIIDESWQFVVHIFIREDCVSIFNNIVGGVIDVKVVELEKMAFPWNWEW
jgi:hypothetical protein